MPAFAPRVPLLKDALVVPSPAVPPYHYSHPNTPEASPHSASTSPASSVSLQTPPDAHESGFIKVVSADSSPVEPPVIPHGHSHGSRPILVKPTKAVASVSPASSAVALKKPKTSHGQFAYATRAVWCTSSMVRMIFFLFFLFLVFFCCSFLPLLLALPLHRVGHRKRRGWRGWHEWRIRYILFFFFLFLFLRSFVRSFLLHIIRVQVAEPSPLSSLAPPQSGTLVFVLLC